MNNNLETTKRFRDAFLDNCKKLSIKWGESEERIKKYFINYVESKVNVLNTLPVDFYKDLYNETIKELKQ